MQYLLIQKYIMQIQLVYFYKLYERYITCVKLEVIGNKVFYIYRMLNKIAMKQSFLKRLITTIT